MLFTTLIYVLVNYLLIKGVAGLMRRTISAVRLIVSTIISGCYVFACLITNDAVLCSVPAYILTVFFTACISFGLNKRCWPCICAFVFLYLSLGGVYIKRHAVACLLIGTIGILLISFVASLQHNRRYVHVELRYNEVQHKFNALLDTGNMLTDPVSGHPVMIVGADIAHEMTGLTVDQLRTPVASVNKIHGLRLIPYKTVSQSGLLLLGVYVPYLKVDSWQGSGIVAFSPELLGSKSTYQALTGGYL